MFNRYLGGTVLSLAALLGPSVHAQEAIRAWNIHSEGLPITVAMESFASTVNAATGGKYKLTVFNNGSLGDQPKAVKMLQSGELDVAGFNFAPLSEFAPSTKVLNVPFLFRDSKHMFSHLDGKMGERFSEQLKASGFVVLGWYDGGGRSFYCKGTPINHVRDLAGLRIRVQSSGVFFEMTELLGGKPVSVPFKDVYAAFEKDEIDCAENNMSSFESTGHFKLAQNVYLTNHVVTPEVLVVSSKLWSKLSPEEKKIFSDVGKQSALLMRDLWNKRTAQALETVKKAGVNVVQVRDSGAMIVRMKPLYARYMNNPETRGDLLTILAN